MSAELVLNFFPATAALVRSYLPRVWDHYFPKEGQRACPAPLFKVEFLNGSSLELRWPFLVPLCFAGINVGSICGLQMLERARSTPKPARAAFAWAHAFLWYAAMCAGALVYHCLSPGRVYRIIDIASTSCCSSSIVAALLAHGGLCDDTVLLGKLGLLLLEASIVVLAIFAPPLIQEQLYLFPTFLCGLLLMRILYLSVRRYSSKRKVLGHLTSGDVRSGRLWLGLASLCALIGFGAVRLDSWLCTFLGNNFLVIFWVFLGSNLALYFLYLFANELIVAQLLGAAQKGD